MNSTVEKGIVPTIVITVEKRIPHDKTIKIAVLAAHYVGFCAWYGGALLDAEPTTLFPVITVVSGVLLTVRELYKEGLGWLLSGEGVCSWVKVLILVAGVLTGRYEVAFLSVVLILGIFSSELPDRIRKGMLFR